MTMVGPSTFPSAMAVLSLLLALRFGGELVVTGAPLHQMPDQSWRGAGAEELDQESMRGERCIGMLGSARGAVQGLIGDAAKSKTPAERLQEFRNRVEAVRSLVVPPGLRRAQTPSPSTPVGQPPTGLPLFGQPSAGTGLLPQPSSSSGTGYSILGQPSPSGAELPTLAPVQRTLADIRTVLAPSDGPNTSLPVSPFTNKQVAAALSIPEGIMKNTAEILGVTKERLVDDTTGTEGILGSVRTHTPESDVDKAPNKQSMLADILNTAVAPIESADRVDENKQVEHPHTAIPESLLPYVPRIPRPLNIPGVLERIPEREPQ